MENFKGNSDASKLTVNDNRPEKRFDAVTSNVTVEKNTSELSKLKKRFFAQDIKSVASNVLDKVIVPSLQKLLSDTFKQSLDWLIYGTKGSSSPYSNQPYGNVSYSRYYQQQNPENQVPVWARPQQTPVPGPYAVNSILFAERADAEIVLARMQEAVDNYGMVSVADFYDMINQTCSFTDQKWGWVNLNNDIAYVVRNGDQFSINFPPVRALE